MLRKDSPFFLWSMLLWSLLILASKAGRKIAQRLQKMFYGQVRKRHNIIPCYFHWIKLSHVVPPNCIEDLEMQITCELRRTLEVPLQEDQWKYMAFCYVSGTAKIRSIATLLISKGRHRIAIDVYPNVGKLWVGSLVVEEPQHLKWNLVTDVERLNFNLFY